MRISIIGKPRDPLKAPDVAVLAVINLLIIWGNRRIVELVMLRGGLFVSEAAISLALRLEQQGHALTSKDGILLVSNGAKLSVEDRAAVQSLKRHLLAIAGYDAAAAEAPPLDAGMHRPDDVGSSADVLGFEKAAAPQILEGPEVLEPTPKPQPRPRQAAPRRSKAGERAIDHTVERIASLFEGAE